MVSPNPRLTGHGKLGLASSRKKSACVVYKVSATLQGVEVEI